MIPKLWFLTIKDGTSHFVIAKRQISAELISGSANTTHKMKSHNLDHVR